MSFVTNLKILLTFICILSIFMLIGYQVFHVESFQSPTNNFKRFPAFNKRINESQLSKILRLTKIFVDHLEKFNISYIPYGGTLIGIHRHHGIIPWDDDLDFCIDRSEKPLLIKAMAELNKTHRLLTNRQDNLDVWKFYSLTGDPISSSRKYVFRYPFIDIFFRYSRNSTHYEDDFDYKKNYFSKKYMYPLIKRPFHDLLLYTPCDIEKNLKELYSDINYCVSPRYNHISVQGISNPQKMDCKELKRNHPFVEKNLIKDATNNLMIEKLKLNDFVIHTYKYAVPKSCNDKLSFYSTKHYVYY